MTMKLSELKTSVYELLGVTTTAEVKALYSTRNLSLKAEWEAILDELSAGQLNEPSLMVELPPQANLVSRLPMSPDRFNHLMGSFSPGISRIRVKPLPGKGCK